MNNITSPLVSLIVPVYNVAPYLRTCVVSLIHQTYDNLEILLIDDGSTDNSPTICEDMAKTKSYIHVFHKQNGGLSEARNFGLKKAKGEFVFFVDSDDYVRDCLVQDMVTIATKMKSDIVQFNYKKVSPNNFLKTWPKKNNEYIKLGHDKALESCLDYNEINIMAWNKMYRRSLFNDIEFPPQKIHEDEAIMPFIMDKSKSYVIVKDVYYAYLQRNGSIMHSSFNKKELYYYDIYDKRLSHFNKKYDYRYNSIILYHAFVASQRLYLNLKKESVISNDSLSTVNNKSKEYFINFIKSRNKTLKMIIKIFLYKTIPRGMFKLKNE